MGKAQPSMAFLQDSGETGALMRSHDWSASPLGDPTQWPQSLRLATGLPLHSKFPMFVAWGKELGFLYNDAYAEILGNKHPAALGKRFQEVWSEIWDDIHPLIERAMAGEAIYRENLLLMVRRRGVEEKAWFTFSYSPVHDEAGAVAGMYCAVTETTHQVLAQLNRLQEVDRLRHLFEQAPGLMAIYRGPDHVIELVNSAYRQLVGQRDLVGRPVREALPEVEGQGFFELMDKVYRTGEAVTGREVPINLRRQPDGTLQQRFVDFLFQSVKDDTGRVAGIFVQGTDVTDSVIATLALRESEQRLRQLANTIPHLAWMADSDGWIHWYNDRWYEYTGTTLEQMQGWGWQSIHDPEKLPHMMEVWKTSIETGVPFETTFPLRGADGTYRTFFTRAAPLRDAAGRIIQWFGTNTDVTPLEQAHDDLRLANRRKDEFLAMLAHELRNPLAPINTAAELLSMNALDAERVRQTSGIIIRQVGHMTQLVDDLLDVSRVTRGLVTLHKETLDVSGVVAEAVEQVQSMVREKRQRLTVQIPDRPVFLAGDRTRLIQVVANILNNAAKYTPENGNIVLAVAVREPRIEISVRDDGTGMTPALLPHVFDLFTHAERSPARSQGGLGLGLALVKSLVELHGGSVHAHSDGPNRGSTFSVVLPGIVHAPGRAEGKAGVAAPDARSNALNLMVVDDNPDITRTLSLLLQTIGHTVSVENTGQRAIERARQQAPQVLFLDIGLPDMDGYELARRLRSLPQTARSMLVAVTGYGQPRDRELAREAGFDHHLVKPVKLASILSLLAGFQKPGSPQEGFCC